MIPVDSLTVDSLVTGMEVAAQPDSSGIALSGIAVVFMGLVLIALTIHLFNKIFASLSKDKNSTGKPDQAIFTEARSKSGKKIPNDHLAAIGIAVELYQRLHLAQPESRVTFIRGETHSEWKAGSKYGQRQSLR